MSADATSAQGLQTIDEWIRSLRGLAPHLESAGPKEMAAVVEEHLTAAANEGRMAGGEAWPPRVKDGARAFVHAAKYLSVRAVKNVIIAELRGPMAISQFGTGRQKARPLWPIKGLPFELGNAIRLGIVRMSEEFMTRHGSHRKKGGSMWGKTS